MIDTVVRTVERIAGLLLLAVALLTFTIVILRKGFATDIPDWYDFSRLMQGMAIFWGIAAACYRGGHIVVDLLWDLVGPKNKRAIDAIANVILVLFIGAFAVFALIAAIEMRGKNLQTSDLRLPQWGFYFIAALGIAGAAVMAAIRAVAMDRAHRANLSGTDDAHLAALLFPLAGAGLTAGAVALMLRISQTNNALLAALAFALMFLLMIVRVPIGVAMGIVGVVGYGVKSGFGGGFAQLGQVPWSVVTDYNFSVIPMFVLMGTFAAAAGMSRDLFHAGEAWFGHRRGGLAIGSIFACGGFAAINGSAVATAATMSTVALPEMRKRNYNAGFAAGVVAAGGTIGIMIPPSVIFVLYGIMTETDIAKLFFAGVVPGLMAIVMYSITIMLVGIARPDWLPLGRRWPWSERWRSLANIWPVAALFLFVLGGMYGGLFLTSEAAGVGAVGALILGLLRRTLSPSQIMECLVESLKVTASIFLVVIGAYLFGYFLTITQTTQAIVSWLTSLPIGRYEILAIILVGYFILGALMDELAMILLTVPIVHPVMMQLGFDPVWFGVIIVMAVTLGMICPPVGINVFVINSIHRDISLPQIYAGVMPFIASDILRLIILCAFPSLALALPNAMEQPMGTWVRAIFGF